MPDFFQVMKVAGISAAISAGIVLMLMPIILATPLAGTAAALALIPVATFVVAALIALSLFDTEEEPTEH